MIAITFLRDHKTRVFTDKTDAGRCIGVSARTISRYCEKKHPSIDSKEYGPMLITDDVEIKKSERGPGKFVVKNTK